MAALSLGDRFSRIYDNPYNAPSVRGVQLDFDLVRERRWARLESARTDVTEARPGDEITIETLLRPYRGELHPATDSDSYSDFDIQRVRCASWSVTAKLWTASAVARLRSAANSIWLPPLRC